MNETPLPDSSELTQEDFIRCGWREIIGNTQIDSCVKVYEEFDKSYKEAYQDGDLLRAKVLLILAGACSMMLTNKSPSKPFVPRWEFDGRSSPTPDWFSESDIKFLAEILDNIDQPMLKGRIADLVWLKKTPTDYKFALEAIDNYRSLDLNPETWATEIGAGWRRAMALTKMMRTAAGDRIEEMETNIRTKFNSATKEDKLFGHWLAETLKEFALGSNLEESIAKKLETLAHELEGEGDFYAGRDYFRLAGEWFGAAGLDSKQTDMTVGVAEGYVKEAKARMSSDTPSALVAVEFYDNAIQTYREISRRERQARQIDLKIDELIHLHQEAGELALGEMKTVSTPGLDISEMVQQSRATVGGKTPIEALNNLASQNHTDVRELRKSAQENLKRFPFVALTSQTILSEDGRVAAKSPGILKFGSSDKDEPALWAQMIQEHGIRAQLQVIGCILPALEVMHIEHRFQESDFIALARNSPAVPPGREELFGKALFSGYERDFTTALHLLAPQIEHMVRYRLKSVGVITTHTDPTGIEDEKGLSALVESAEFQQIFGEDIAFEIEALLSSHFGANLKNNVSHGLLTYQQCNSVESIYAWWLGLKIVFKTYWGAYQRHMTNPDSTDPANEGEAGADLGSEE